MINQSPLWQELVAHQAELSNTSLIGLFQADPDRQQQMSLTVAGIELDYSKNLITSVTLEKLINLTRLTPLTEKINALFSGQPINLTEKRAASHIQQRSSSWIESTQSLKKIALWCQAFDEGKALSASGQKFTDIVHIGIGGSLLGPELALQALLPWQKKSLRCHFISTIDPALVESTLALINPDTTLFIVASKSFNTEETLANATFIKNWLLKQGLDTSILAKQFIAITAQPQKALAFGVAENHIFTISESIGGRYSVWSAMGLPLALMIGFEHFRDVLQGAEQMDQHFLTAPTAKNMPIILGLLGIWYRNFFHTQSHAIIPYAYQLRLLPEYLQQLDMESNGKRCTLNLEFVNYATAPVIWGVQGTNSQHSFHQLLHQGTDVIPVDFIVAKQSDYDAKQHQRLLAHCQAQALALMQGEKTAEIYRATPGNRPSSTLLLDKITPTLLGSLLALYEHKVFVQSVIWNINPFDQWGVELGKKLAKLDSNQS